MGKVVMYGSVSVDGFVADENDQPGPLFDWLSSGDVPLDESGYVKVSQTSYDYTRPYWDQIGVTIAGRHVFDLTDGWDGTQPSGIDHVVVVTHRPQPEGWDPEAPFHFVDGVEAAVAKAQELAGDRIVEVAAGDVGGQALAAGLVDEVRMDVVPVVFGSGKRYFGSVDAQHLLEDPDVVIQGNRVLHLRYRVRRDGRAYECDDGADPRRGPRRRVSLGRDSGLAEDAVEVGAADGADGLGHPGALVVDPDLALCLALLLALHAVELAAPGLRHDGLLAFSMFGRRGGDWWGSPPGSGRVPLNRYRPYDTPERRRRRHAARSHA